MRISPQYSAQALVMDGPVDDHRVPFVRHLERMQDMLRRFEPEQWNAPSRCDQWTARDVVCHLIVGNGFWHASIEGGRRGEPTRLLDGFDPATTPSMFVATMKDFTDTEVLERFCASCVALVGTLGDMSHDEWLAIGESPVGYVSLRLVAGHAMWDSWVHERDIAVPLGLSASAERDELSVCLHYAAAVNPAIGLGVGVAPPGRYAVDAVDPDLRFTVVVGHDDVAVLDGVADDEIPVLRGRAVDLIDSLSVRAAMPADAPAAWTALRAGLGTVFDAV